MHSNQNTNACYGRARSFFSAVLVFTSEKIVNTPTEKWRAGWRSRGRSPCEYSYFPHRGFSRWSNSVQDYIVTKQQRVDHQPDSRSGVALILWTLRSVPLNSSSALKRMPTSFFNTP